MQNDSDQFLDALPFPPAVKSRGREYHREGRVTITGSSRDVVKATVRGTRSYRVVLLFNGKHVSGSCDCVYYTDVGPCKHLWATLLEAYGRGLLDDQTGRNEPQRPRQSGRTLPGPAPSGGTARARLRGAPSADSWRHQLERIGSGAIGISPEQDGRWPASREICYAVDVDASLGTQQLVVETMARDRKANGEWGAYKAVRVSSSDITSVTDAVDRDILTALGGSRGQSYNYYRYADDSAQSRYHLAHAAQQLLLPRMAESGKLRFRLPGHGAELRTIGWDDGPPWEFRLRVTIGADGKGLMLTGGVLREGRGPEVLSINEIAVTLASGFVVIRDKLARLAVSDIAIYWIGRLREIGALLIPAGEEDTFLQILLTMPNLPEVDLPPSLGVEEIRVVPRPGLRLARQRGYRDEARYWSVGLSFDYEGEIVSKNDPATTVYRRKERRLIRRDFEFEKNAQEHVRELGARRHASYYDTDTGLQVSAARMQRLVETLISEGWRVEADGKLYRSPGESRLQISSGVDWFELHGGVDFDGMTVGLPALLAAVRKGSGTVVLDDGTLGILPAEWLKRLGPVVGMGNVEGNHVRFSRVQAGLLDALLAAQPDVSIDETFLRIREELMRFEGIAPLDPPETFRGTLRGYQREGLGWLMFLNRFGIGGCLADDMGTGKTIQVLALLESRRLLDAGPSIIVVPTSLVFNWKEEAARFTPGLRILDHTGPGRRSRLNDVDQYDVLLTTYGTLRSDAALLSTVTFDYAILDEAQAVKNASTVTAKTVRLLRAAHRLAMSGTPVENHLGELWSLFDFLNPGLLGSMSRFQVSSSTRLMDEESLTLLRHALRPMILRRTKEQVASELPAKMEQTIYCELEPRQRRQYNELRDHYRSRILETVGEKGIAGSKIQILEALLRLRQAACHPGLVDAARVDEPSAKLDALLEQLGEVVDGGHKALVFSQFTSMLSIVRSRLDERKMPYEYLDGRTRNRQAIVERFQTDPERKIFLISLKAGGVGLNLTAAEYVFLLDPWWNPAAEAQAVDRAHRIGQKLQVFAYRLIARDTVEEKVVQLQNSKRELADAIITADNSLIRGLGREELELLLS